MVTHDPLAAAYADRVLYLADGAVAAADECADGRGRRRAHDAPGGLSMLRLAILRHPRPPQRLRRRGRRALLRRRCSSPRAACCSPPACAARPRPSAMRPPRSSSPATSSPSTTASARYDYEDVLLPERVRVDTALAARLAAVPGVRQVVRDVSVRTRSSRAARRRRRARRPPDLRSRLVERCADAVRAARGPRARAARRARRSTPGSRCAAICTSVRASGSARSSPRPPADGRRHRRAAPSARAAGRGVRHRSRGRAPGRPSPAAPTRIGAAARSRRAHSVPRGRGAQARAGRRRASTPATSAAGRSSLEYARRARGPDRRDRHLRRARADHRDVRRSPRRSAWRSSCASARSPCCAPIAATPRQVRRMLRWEAILLGARRPRRRPTSPASRSPTG